MSAALNGPAAAVAKPGSCDREVYIGETRHVIKHSWRVHALGVQLTTVLVDKRRKSRISKIITAYVDNTEEALSSKGAEMAVRILSEKRDAFMKAQQRQGGQGVSGGKITNGESGAGADVIVLALRGGSGVAGRTRSGMVRNLPAVPPACQEVRARL